MNISIAEASTTTWDAVVIGAGMGGSAAAFSLSEQGMNVLVIERGLDRHEATSDISTDNDDPDERVRIGRFPDKIRGQVDGGDFDFFAPLGSGAGGSTALYASALDRFRPSDFETRGHPVEGTIEWPVSFDAFQPWYKKAEAALSVSGDRDPLTEDGFEGHLTPPELSPRDADIFHRLQNSGLNPYRLHSGYHFAPDCGPCLGRVCLKDCKRHAGNSFLEPALETGRVAILTEAQVETLEAHDVDVTGANLLISGERIQVRGRFFLLAAGTFFTPTLMLASKSEAWPEGLGNRHDQVGRRLMFHTGRSLAIWSNRSKPHSGNGKTIVFRDFYDGPNGKFGEVQSTGAEASYGNIVYALRQMLVTGRLRHVPLLWHLARIPAFAASKLLGKAAVFELVMEDLPYPENRVSLDETAPSGMRFEYTVHSELKERFDQYCLLVRKNLKGTPNFFLTLGLHLNYGHPMGTCRIGIDQRNSVAGPDGRTHGLTNLFIVDGAAMPTSGGTNPSLTIAANALRIADKLGKSPEGMSA